MEAIGLGMAEVLEAAMGYWAWQVERANFADFFDGLGFIKKVELLIY
jgi:hypothetical protein